MKRQTVHQVLQNAILGDLLSDGKRQWKVVETEKEGSDCTVAVPHHWDDKKMGSKFELWDDAQAKVSYIPKLQIVSTI